MTRIATELVRDDAGALALAQAGDWAVPPMYERIDSVLDRSSA